MAFELKPGQGSIFKNDKKTEDKHPDYKGSCVTPDGQECWVSLWVKKSADKPSFFSMSIQPKEQQAPLPPAPTPNRPDTDDLPF